MFNILQCLFGIYYNACVFFPFDLLIWYMNIIIEINSFSITEWSLHSEIVLICAYNHIMWDFLYTF